MTKKYQTPEQDPNYNNKPDAFQRGHGHYQDEDASFLRRVDWQKNGRTSPGAKDILSDVESNQDINDGRSGPIRYGVD